MLHTTRRLIALRKARAALSAGAFEVVDAAGDLFMFDRVLDGDRLRCVFNFGAGEAGCTFELKPEVLWSAGAAVVGSQLVLEPYSAAILKLS